MTVYPTDMDDYRRTPATSERSGGGCPDGGYPAMAGIGVTRLWDATALAEVQGSAVV